MNSGDQGIEVDGKEVPTYDLRRLRSSDGLSWPRQSGQVVMELPPDDDEYGFGRPYVVRDETGYELWYSIRTRSKGYRIGYATETGAGELERRDDEVGITVSDSGWDAEMVCFPALIEVGSDRYLFYNGNNFGETGFGVARELTDS